MIYFLHLPYLYKDIQYFSIKEKNMLLQRTYLTAWCLHIMWYKIPTFMWY